MRGAADSPAAHHFSFFVVFVTAMRRVCRRGGGALAALSASRAAAVPWSPVTFTASSSMVTAATAARAVSRQAVPLPSASTSRCELCLLASEQPHRWAVLAGSGASSPALFGPTRVARIPPQLLRMIMTGATALLQVFVVAYGQESEKIRRRERADRKTGAGDAAPTSDGLEREMSATEAMQILGLDRSFPDLFNTVQQAEATGAARPSPSPSPLPLPPGKAREAARQNFDRMFALAVKEDNMFLAGKLSAAYRVCVDPAWDCAAAANESGAAASSDAGPGQQAQGGPTV